MAGRPEYADAQRRLAEQLLVKLKAGGDPLVVGGAERLGISPAGGESPVRPCFVPKR